MSIINLQYLLLDLICFSIMLESSIKERPRHDQPMFPVVFIVVSRPNLNVDH